MIQFIRTLDSLAATSGFQRLGGPNPTKLSSNQIVDNAIVLASLLQHPTLIRGILAFVWPFHTYPHLLCSFPPINLGLHLPIPTKHKYFPVWIFCIFSRRRLKQPNRNVETFLTNNSSSQNYPRGVPQTFINN